MEAFIRVVEILGQRPVREPAPQPEPHNRPSNNIAEYKRLSALAFSGTTYPIEAEKWLTEIEKTFSILDFFEEENVSHAAYMLQGDAWLTRKCQHATIRSPLTGRSFKRPSAPNTS